MIRARWALAAFSIATAATGQTPPPAPPLAGIPNLVITYYDVSGRDPDAIRRSMNAVRPRDENDNSRVDALSHWQMRWRWLRSTDGGCDLTSATVEFSGTLLMPRLADEDRVPERVRTRWHAFIAALSLHEDGHLRYAYEHVGDVLAAIRSSDCPHAGDAARAALQRVARHDIEYDRETRHGAAQGVRFP